MLKTPFAKLQRNRAYRLKHREAILYHKRNNRLRRFGLQPTDLTRMLEEQAHCCKVCGIGPLLREGKTNLSAHIDHCHDCGKVRALVCKRCNTMLGFIESDYDSFAKAWLYHVDHVLDTNCLVENEKTNR